MEDNRAKYRITPPRIQLTDSDLKQFADALQPLSISEMVQRTGLSYQYIYNVVHGRLKSITRRNYQLLFEKDPATQEPKKVDGFMFRQLVKLWLYLNDDVTKADLFREFFSEKQAARVDYRLFTGQIQTVDPKLEKIMWKKFVDAGLDKLTVEAWIEELSALDTRARIPYEKIRPILMYLQKELNVHPTTILNQSFHRYESGKLQSVSGKIYNRIIKLKESADQALAMKNQLSVESLREEIYGKKERYVLYLEIEEELQFLRKHAHRSARQYLGRGTKVYETGQSKRIASWRFEKIRADCDQFILGHPEIPLLNLPKKQLLKWVNILTSVMKSHIAHLLSHQEGIVFEKRVLMPSHTRDEYRKHAHGFTLFDMASNALGMNKKAFDLMVSKNCEIFKEVGKYANRWYLSDLYLRELSENALFKLITFKYELMAKDVEGIQQSHPCGLQPQ